MQRALEGKGYVEQYVQSLTHELKSPVSAIRGAAELLRQDMGVEDRARFLETIARESGRLQEVIDRMLELASLESRSELRDPEDLDLADLAESCAASLADTASARAISVSVTAPEPVRARGERFLVRQALLNLLNNSLDFTPPGGAVGVAVSRDGELVRMTVEDTGPGVPDYARDKVFARFYSLPRPATGRKSTGLGLPFVRQVAELHGGSVSLTNRPEGGARAELLLPAAV